MRSANERASMLAARVDKLISLRRRELAERRVGIVLFNFPPNAGNVGTAAFLSVFESLHNVLSGMKAQGYTVDVPASVDELRRVGSRAIDHGKRLGPRVHERIEAFPSVQFAERVFAWRLCCGGQSRGRCFGRLRDCGGCCNNSSDNPCGTRHEGNENSAYRQQQPLTELGLIHGG
jgi:hypothetical protein